MLATSERQGAGWHAVRGVRLFASSGDAPRARRASDVVVLVASVSGVAFLSWITSPPPSISEELSRFLASFPSFLDGLWELSLDLASLMAAVLVLGALLRRRITLVRDLLLAAAGSVAVWLVISRLVEGSWPEVGEALAASDPPPWFPSLRIAIPAAVIMTAAPHLSQPVRRLGRWLVLLAAVGAVVLGATPPEGAVAGVLVAAISAAVVHLALGSSGGRPSLADVREALAELGVSTQGLDPAERRAAGLFVVHAVDEQGDPLVVKVFGRDAHDSELMTKLWRTVWLRESGSPIQLGRQQQVEHEAFLTLLAGQAGVPGDTVVTAGSTDDEDAILVLRPWGRPLADLPPERFDPELLAGVWAALRRLHDAGIAHGRCDDRSLVVVDDGEVGLTDFGDASVGLTDSQRRTDEAQVLVTTALLAGERPALDAAIDALGRDGLTAVLPFVQLLALAPGQRQRVRRRQLDLDELRREAAEVVGVEPPALQQLRRITLGTLVKLLLPGVALLALVSYAADLDWQQLWESVVDADWSFVILGVVVAQLPRLSQAVSTCGASPVPLPLGPVYALQLTISYVNLAIPSVAGRMAVNIRFFQRHGVAAGTALAAGALDGFSGFVIQVTLLLTLLLGTQTSLDLELDSGQASGAAVLLLVVVLAAAVAIAAVFVLPRPRRWVLAWARRLLAEAGGAVRGLRSPRRLLMLFGGNLATELLFAMALGAFARALGFPIGLGELVLINVAVALLSGLMPIPGGIGVAEGGLSYGLMRAGVPEESAFAIAIMYRLASFYLPPIWGFFAFRWLERNDHL